MPGLFRSLFTSPERSGQRLNSDAVAVIYSDQKSGSTEFVQSIADLARDELANVESRLIAHPKNRDTLVYDLQQKHKEARRRRDNALFSALTLVLIYARAKDLGEPGEAAIQTIDNFIASPVKHSKEY